MQFGFDVLFKSGASHVVTSPLHTFCRSVDDAIRAGQHQFGAGSSPIAVMETYRFLRFCVSPGGTYRLTPLYDIVSAQPSLDAGQIRRNKLKMAMAVGNKRHYTMESILRRHFVQSAEKGGLALR